MDKLIFATSGSVDDGKSTLIGRLLYDANAITETQREFLNDPKNFTDDWKINLSLLTDGLKSEKEQGITIDVAYKYFQTDKRRFIIADTPGHHQYTRNAVTGISNAHLGIVLIDARHGITTQTRIHSAVFGLLQTNTVVVCINKMDMVDYSQSVFNKIAEDYKKVAKSCNVKINFIVPTSAFVGDNIVNRSEKMDWYAGQTLLDILETTPIHSAIEQPKFAVQNVIRPMTQSNPDYRGYAGRVNSGTFNVGDTVIIQPSEITTIITNIEQYGEPVKTLKYGMSGTLLLESNIDIDRGDIITVNPSPTSTQFNANVCWLGTTPLNIHKRYIVRHLTKFSFAMLTNINHKIDIDTFEHSYGTVVKQNDIANITVRTQEPLSIEDFTNNKQAGQFIIIDETDNQTVAVGMITMEDTELNFLI